MAVDVEVERVIAAPLEEVAAFAGDPGNAPSWYANIRSVRWRSEPPVRVGSRMDFVAGFLGRRLAYTYEVVDLVPGRRLVMRTTDGPFPMETTYTWSPHSAGTTMSLRNRGEPSGFGRVAAPAMERAMRRAMTRDLECLEALLAGRSRHEGPARPTRAAGPDRAAQAFLLFRLAAGLAFLAVPRRAARPWLGDEPGIPTGLVRYGIGGRDVVLSLGGLHAVDRGTEAARWLRLAAAAEAADALLTLLAPAPLARRTRVRGVLGAATLAATAWGLAGRERR